MEVTDVGIVAVEVVVVVRVEGTTNVEVSVVGCIAVEVNVVEKVTVVIMQQAPEVVRMVEVFVVVTVCVMVVVRLTVIAAAALGFWIDAEEYIEIALTRTIPQRRASGRKRLLEYDISPLINPL